MMKEKIKECLYNNWLMTFVLGVILLVALMSVIIGSCMYITANTPYPAWKNAHMFYTSEEEMYFIYYDDNYYNNSDGKFMILSNEGKIIYTTDRAVEVLPGDTVVFKNENGTNTSVDLINSTVSISRRDENVND